MPYVMVAIKSFTCRVCNQRHITYKVIGILAKIKAMAKTWNLLFVRPGVDTTLKIVVFGGNQEDNHGVEKAVDAPLRCFADDEERSRDSQEVSRRG